MILFIGNLDKLATEKDLMEIFTSYAKVSKMKILRDPVSRRSRGCAFVDIADEFNPEKIAADLNNTQFMNNQIIVHRASAAQNKGLSW